MSTPFGLDLVKLEGVTAPQPYMRPSVAERYIQLRATVLEKTGVDFLAKCGDVFREAAFHSSKDGVAERSWHKTGRVFDYNQESKAIVIVSEPSGGQQFFRTYLKCGRQDGSQGIKKTVHDYRGYNVSAYLFDFTAAAQVVGFHRIPAWSGWQTHYNRREFWHYQCDEGLTWDAAMAQLKGKPTAAATTTHTPTLGSQDDKDTVLGLNDRGTAVRSVQATLVGLHLLPQKECDGIYGSKTKAAVAKFQKTHGLPTDGLVGPLTRAKLFS
ncbi:MAG TPA: peptidoglycan-binding domain-containing protein [Pyrinomonadaceae bacterium]|jgi:hypothetical protein|nr:peptidoglycan-binding domain-containing protein [Pyrinomonadaceae bacterium]